MKLHVVIDEHGNILAAARLDENASVQARPIADEDAGHRAAQVYVPAEFRHYDLAGVCHRMKVDVSGKFSDLKAKE